MKLYVLLIVNIGIVIYKLVINFKIFLREFMWDIFLKYYYILLILGLNDL